MRFLLGRRGVVVALTVFASFGMTRSASAFCRTTTQALPANYSPSRGCFTEGLFLYWRNACVSYSVQADGSRSIPFDDAKRIIDLSFSKWVTAACPDTGTLPGIAISSTSLPAQCTEVRYNPESPNQNLIVFRDNGWPYNDPNNTLGLTTVTFNAETGEIYDADLELNASGRNLSITDQVPANGFDLESVVTHEAGHFFGLAHATDARATMFASYKPGTTALRSLTPDDLAGLCAIYPDAQSRIVTPTSVQQEVLAATPCDPTPRHGLTAACEEPRRPAEKTSACATSPRPSGGTGVVGGILGLGAAALVRRRRARREGRSSG
jgi:hypothetical protein